jgi:M-phase inducer tyrosine phosphatase
MDRLGSTESTSIRYIDGLLLKEVLHGKYDSMYNSKFIIDCRFAYEYAGGHIQGAENHWTYEMIDALLFRNPPSSNRALIVLHCEYSERRAPRM